MSERASEREKNEEVTSSLSARTHTHTYTLE